DFALAEKFIDEGFPIGSMPADEGCDDICAHARDDRCHSEQVRLPFTRGPQSWVLTRRIGAPRTERRCDTATDMRRNGPDAPARVKGNNREDGCAERGDYQDHRGDQGCERAEYRQAGAAERTNQARHRNERDEEYDAEDGARRKVR